MSRLMRLAGLSPHCRPRRVRTTDSQHNDPVAQHLLQRDFSAQAPNENWLADITAIWTAERWLYLAGILDVSSRMVLGWAMAANRDERLVEEALWMALRRLHSAAGLLQHSDRGSQYTSLGYQDLLTRFGLQVSMSRKGDCYDNAMMERFSGTLKGEWTDRHSYQTPQRGSSVHLRFHGGVV